MDLENQRRVKESAEQFGKDNLIVILGSGEPEGVGLAAETVISGDPTYAGPLAGVSLGLPVYHIMESAIKAQVDPTVYDEQVGVMAMVLNVEGIQKELDRIRGQIS